MKDNKTYSIYEHRIKPNQLTKDMMKDFVVYLESRSEGEGARSIYQRFKKVVTYAVEHGVMSNNPCNGVSIKVDGQRLRKDVLSLSEIDQLINTHYRYENPQVRNAFIFCLYTGLRFCDVKTLTYGNVDYQNKMLNFEQHKTKGHSQNSGVIIPLNDGLLSLIGSPKTDNINEELIFELPTYESCCKSVKRWVKRAGINKHISWHCARHSFATNILDNGANIVTVANLLGHSGLKHTEKYLRAIDDRKREAINSLPELNHIIMTRAEAWETLEDLEFLCRYIDATESSIVYNTIVKSDRYKGIGQRLKTLKEQIINDNDADLARKIYSLVHEDKFEGGNICNAFYRLSVDLENEKEFAEEMELCNKVLTDISYWLLESVYGIPKDKSYAYYI